MPLRLHGRKRTELKLTKAQRKVWEDDWKAHNKNLRQKRLGKPISFDQYVLERTGQTKCLKTSNEIPSYDHPRSTGHIPSRKETGSGAVAKPETKRYSGDRKLVGIGTLHKSNLVPIFSDDEAKDIANMRRN